MADEKKEKKKEETNEKAGGLIGFLFESYKTLVAMVAWLLIIFGAVAGGSAAGFVGFLIGIIIVLLLEALILPPMVILFYIHTELVDIKELLKK